MKKFNINKPMYVRITDIGFKYLKEKFDSDYIKHCIESRKVEIDGEDWYRLQCWTAFDIMPPDFGGRNKFMSGVMFEDNDLE